MIADPRREMAFRANELAPDARAEERQLLLDALQLAPGCSVLEVGAWDGYLATKLVDHDGHVILLDRMQVGVLELRKRFPDLSIHEGLQERMPVMPATVDRVASLVALHHISAPSFVREAKRVLAPGGRVAIVEVGLGSLTATFLDSHVNAMTTPRGHIGIYLTPQGWKLSLEGAGFVNVSVEERIVHWRFSTMSQATEYCRLVFGLSPSFTDAQIQSAIEALDPLQSNSGLRWEWPLVVASGDVAM